MNSPAEPLTLGTAGHVDHGKTALVGALTGVDTDRLPEEKMRGLSIVLGYAPLRLPSGRQLSAVDVPGHERFVRTMVAGASGVDLFLMVIAADDGVMPQTIEHASILRALGVASGVVAITKSDLADPSAAASQAIELLPGTPIIDCSARTRCGLTELLRALEDAALNHPSRASSPGDPCLHIDRAFTIKGRGTVVTGTLWSGAISSGDVLELLPACVPVRVRDVEVHGLHAEQAHAGQRVAVNVVGAKGRRVKCGDVLAAPGTLSCTTIMDCALDLRDARNGERVQVHHGTRAVAGRLAALDDGLWQIRVERPLLARSGDHVVVRRLAPANTLGGGIVLDAAASRHGKTREILDRLHRMRDGETERATAKDDVTPTGLRRSVALPTSAVSAADECALLALEQRLLDAGTALLPEARIGGDVTALRALRSSGQAVRVSGRLYAHAIVLADVRERIVGLIERDGPVALGEVRDALGLSRRTTQAFLEHLDSKRVTRRLPDDTRVLSARKSGVPERLA